jgi:predicted amidohydrolase
MRICVAQTRAIKGDIQRNIANHLKFIELAVAESAELIIFPELSLTGYEPQLAKELAMSEDDVRFEEFQKISDNHKITIGIGAPTKNNAGICITMVLFRPKKERQTYSKKYLHPDEELFFVSGQSFTILEVNQTRVALAICYELSVPEHSQKAFDNGAEIYVTSVAKSLIGVEKASQTLSDIANKYALTVLMSNCLGPSDDFEGAGKTSIWNNKGVLVGQLDGIHEGITWIDTDTQETVEKLV